MPRRRRPPRPGALHDLAPLRILTQILTLQAIYYLSALILIIFTALVAGRPIKLRLLLSWKSLRGDITAGWLLGVVWMLNSLITVIPLLLLIARSKLIPDFALTIHALHLIITSLYTRSIPTYWFWWALQVASAALMTALGVWSCQWRELRPINFGGSGGNKSTGKTAEGAARPDAGAVEAQENGDAQQGFVRGKGRGRGRDGGGTYEMVGMASQDENV